MALRRLFASLALLLAACGSAEPPAVRPRPPLVVWIEVDTLRADALGAYGAVGVDANGAPRSPALDGLARDGVLFEACYAAAPWTVPSLASQLTGRWPFEHGALQLLEPLPPEFLTLPEVLRSEGWGTVGVGTNFVATGRFGFDQGFERWDDSLAEGHEGSTGSAAVARLLELIDQAEPSDDAPVFAFALLFEPHFRYVLQPGFRFGPDYAGPLTGAEELAELRARAAAGELDERDFAFLRGLYAGEVAAVDRAIGELLSGLEARGLGDRALVLFTSDHGEELGEAGWIGHTARLSEALVRVPLVVRPPGSWAAPRGRRVATPVSQVDLARTLLDWLGVDQAARGEHLGSGPSFAGSLFADQPAPRRFLYLHTRFDPVLERSSAKRAHRFGVVDAERRLKWVVDHRAEGDDGRPRGRLVDLASDPEEALDLSESGRLPRSAAYLARRRGLATDPLGARDEGEPIPAPQPPAVGGGAR
ncbi:MAG: sulfatase [Planctomycetota bacterium]